MSACTFLKKTRFHAPASVLFEWHLKPRMFHRLLPPWETVVVEQDIKQLELGARIRLRTQQGPISSVIESEITGFNPPHSFEDTMRKSPFAFWQHQHMVEADGPDHCYLIDDIRYQLPLGWLGHIGGQWFIHNKLQRLFNYRHRVMMHDIQRHLQYKGDTPMKILISGSTGLVGSALVDFLSSGGHEITRLVRHTPAPGDAEVQWDPEQGTLNTEQLEGFDAVIHLAGENIASGPWTKNRKNRIKQSRVEGTRLLSVALATLKEPPKTFICASAIGFYGDTGTTLVNETNRAGEGFLADICRQWEAATLAAKEKGIRVVHMRIGVVMSPKGGALKKMLLPFQLGGGGQLGNGKQYMSWIALDDVVGAIHHALITDTVEGPVNAVSPHAVTNAVFTKTLGHVLFRPTLFPVPAFGLKMLMGEMGETLLLASTRVEPGVLLESGYTFQYPKLNDALRHVLGKT